MVGTIHLNRGGRNEGIELLRVLCMFGIVCLHVIGYSSIAPFGNSASQSIFLLHLRYVLNVGVCVFAFISGFYGIKFSVKKALNLVYIGVFSTFCVFFAEIYLFDVEFSIKSLGQIFFSNWYFREYLILFLISPFINKFFENFNKGELKKVGFPLIILFVWNFFATQFPSSFGQTLSLGNHSAMLLILIYLLARILNKTEFLEKINTWILLLCFIACLLILFFFSRLKDFSSPFCIIAAICLFELFKRLSLPIMLSKIACFLSPSMLGILLLHNAGSHQMKGGLTHRYFENFTGNLSGFSFLKYALIIFTISLAIDFIRRLLLFLIMRFVGDLRQ